MQITKFIAPVSEGAGTAPVVLFESTGVVDMLDSVLTVEQWLAAGQALQAAQEESYLGFAWCWGDWINYARITYSDDVDYIGLAAAVTDKAESTLLNYAWVASKTPHSLRSIKGLSFRHFLEAIREPDMELRRLLLTQAGEEGWSRKKLCEYLPDTRSAADPPPATPSDALFDMQVQAGNLERRVAEAETRAGLIATVTQNAIDQLLQLVDLPADSASVVTDVINQLHTVVAVPHEFVTSFWAVAQLYREGRYTEMAALMDILIELGNEIMPPR